MGKNRSPIAEEATYAKRLYRVPHSACVTKMQKVDSIKNAILPVGKYTDAQRKMAVSAVKTEANANFFVKSITP